METNDSILREAMRRRDAAVAEAARLDGFIKLYQELRGNGTVANVAAPVRPASQPEFNVPVHIARDGVGTKVVETERRVREIISERGAPVATAALVEELARRGFEIGGKDPRATLTARLARAPSITNVRPYGWTLKESGAQRDEAAGQPSEEKPAASISLTPNDADRRGEVAHDIAT